MHCRKLLRHDGALSRHCHLRRWTVFVGLCIGVHELLCGSVSSNRCLHELHKLSHRNISRNDRGVVVDDLRSMHCWKLLRHDGTLGRYGHLRCWAVLPSFGLVLFELPGGSVSSECHVDELHELPYRHFPRHDWSFFVGNLRSLHCWKLLRHDGALGSHGRLPGWQVLGGLSRSVHELRRGSVSSKHRFDWLY